MKRAWIVTIVVLFAAASAGAAAVAFLRPAWLPAWANAPRPSAEPEDAGLYCKEHGVPEKFCTICHKELADKLLLCKEHGGLPEDICTLCHPGAEKKYAIEMCPKGHGLPREFCQECGKVPSAALERPDDGWCAAHGKPEALCLECLPDEAPAKGERPKKCRDPLPDVRLATAGLARKIGLETSVVSEEEHAHTLVANAETAFDANRYAEVSPRVAGFLREVQVDLGRPVRRGDVLAVVDSAEVSAAKTQYLASKAALKLADATAERTQPLARSGVMPRKAELEVVTALNQAQASAMDAQQKLRNLGFDDEALAQILETKDTRSFLPVMAPIDGTIVARHAVQGEAVQATSLIFTVADTSRMWAWIDIYEHDVASLQPGQEVRFRVMGASPDGPAAEGRITWVGNEVDPQTRTTRVRAELANPGGRLRSNQFGQATIQLDGAHKAVVVAKEAVQRKDGVEVVFLPREAGVYRPQRVVTRPADRGDVLEVAWGLKAGDVVVGKGAFLLKTEIMKGSIGAGCCE